MHTVTLSDFDGFVRVVLEREGEVVHLFCENRDADALTLAMIAENVADIQKYRSKDRELFWEDFSCHGYTVENIKSVPNRVIARVTKIPNK